MIAVHINGPITCTSGNCFRISFSHKNAILSGKYHHRWRWFQGFTKQTFIFKVILHANVQHRKLNTISIIKLRGEESIIAYFVYHLVFNVIGDVSDVAFHCVIRKRYWRKFFCHLHLASCTQCPWNIEEETLQWCVVFY